MSTAPDVREIHAAIIARLDELRPLVEECERLEKAEALLIEVDAKAKTKTNGTRRRPARAALSEAELAQEAPYGYKADGTPRKRRPPADPDYARRGWETRREVAESA